MNREEVEALYADFAQNELDEIVPEKQEETRKRLEEIGQEIVINAMHFLCDVDESANDKVVWFLFWTAWHFYSRAGESHSWKLSADKSEEEEK